MKPIILFVDDEVDLLQVLTDAVTLALPDYEVIPATSADEGLQQVDKSVKDGRRIALMVVDHGLGRSTGLDVLEAARKAVPGLQAILFTGQAPASVADRAQAVGATVLWKPVRLQHLLEAIRVRL